MHPKKRLHMQKRNPDRIPVMMKQKRVRQWAVRVDAQVPAEDKVIKLDWVQRQRYKAVA